MTDNIWIKPVETDEEFELVSKMTQYAFYPSPGETSRRDKIRPYFRGDHEFILYDNDEAMATAASIPMTQNIRGKIVEMGGIAGVATYPEARRRGYVKRLMKHLFADMEERGQAASSLYPFRQSFYGRFGYVTFPQTLKVEITCNNLRPLIDKELDIRYDRFLVQDDIERVIQIIREHQQVTHGMGVFPDRILKHLEALDHWVVEMTDSHGKRVGAFIYKMQGFVKPATITQFFEQHAMAKYGLLRYFALHIDQVSKMELSLPRHRFPELWWNDLDVQTSTRDWVASAMGRIVDLSLLEGITVGEGEVHLAVDDPHHLVDPGCKLLVGEDHRLSIEDCQKGHDQTIELTVQGLSALIFGGYDLQNFGYLGWADLTADEIGELSDLFPQIYPEIYQNF